MTRLRIDFIEYSTGAASLPLPGVPGTRAGFSVNHPAQNKVGQGS